MNYKILRDAFSNGSLTLSGYMDWLNESMHTEGEIIEKMVQLTNWNKEALENIKNARIGNASLTKIKSIMDIITRSGINSAVLLKLKELYKLKIDSDYQWKKYTNVLNNLKLSAREEARAEEHIAQQKRDVLSRYMIHELKLGNMRNLYSYLLIDVEMSDCTKISPLKAALNSVQLYIHRCMMRLEKEITIKDLNKEKWKWLSSYHEWEASNKIKLYPENYLDPTLRSIATPEYKTLQGTLMQGNITDESVSNAYVKYFEDFEQVASLKIVDSYFEKVVDKVSGIEKNTLFIIGRTLAKPYMYYYRTAIFDGGIRQKIYYWTAWEEIKASIPAETVTPIYAFDRLFLFWVQKNEKKEINTTGTGGNTSLSLSDSPEVTINYIFQRPSGSWLAQQELASNIKVKPITMAKEITKVENGEKTTTNTINEVEANKLYWKKVAAFYLTEQHEEKGVKVKGTEKLIVITIGKMDVISDETGVKSANLFTLDEDLVTDENKQGAFLMILTTLIKRIMLRICLAT
ncbi:MAG: hypothetical protein PG981_000379 [Wolbachia endosymbiont of Ctenocephalides orientis wCori]|nr:MAG: hypothetical protein PG981_000379 [Wolbachia endosymbiont of Ctenocephalides orientis wCori]